MKRTLRIFSLPFVNRYSISINICGWAIFGAIGTMLIMIIKIHIRWTLIVNMALSDLLHLIFFFPRISVELNTAGYCLVSGPLGQAVCKLSFFATDVSTLVSVESLLLIAVDRFRAVVFPLRSPLISSKLCRYFLLVIWIVAMAVNCPYLIALKVAEYPEGLFCWWQWNDTFGESLSQQTYILGLIVVTRYVPLVLIAILYFVIDLKIKS